MSAAPLLPAMLLLGLASGLHCVGMCGGIAGAFALQRTLEPRRAIAARQLAFNGGRLSSYAALGAAAGALGSAAGLAGIALPLQTALYLLASLVLVLIGLHLAGLAHPLARIEALGAPLWRRLQPHAARRLSGAGMSNAFAAGLLWGLLPCGLVYGALAAAVFAGGPAHGALAMAAFGIGTLPWLLAAGVTAARLRTALRTPRVRIAAGLALLGMGTWGAARASGLADAVQQALLCL